MSSQLARLQSDTENRFSLWKIWWSLVCGYDPKRTSSPSFPLIDIFNLEWGVPNRTAVPPIIQEEYEYIANHLYPSEEHKEYESSPSRWEVKESQGVSLLEFLGMSPPSPPVASFPRSYFSSPSCFFFPFFLFLIYISFIVYLFSFSHILNDIVFYQFINTMLSSCISTGPSIFIEASLVELPSWMFRRLYLNIFAWTF